MPSYDWREVADAIADPLALARSWGLRIASDRPNDAGWVECRALGREDRHPSAMFGIKGGGQYWEPHMGNRPISIFKLAVELGIYPDFPTAVNSLGQQFCGRQHAG